MATINKINVNGTEYDIESIKESYKGVNIKTVQAADGDEYYICTFNEYIEDSGLLGKVNIYTEPLTRNSKIEVIDYSIIQTLGDPKGAPGRINVDKTTSDCDIERVIENYSEATSGEVYRWYFRFPLSQNYPSTGARWRSIHGTIKFRISD